MKKIGQITIFIIIIAVIVVMTMVLFLFRGSLLRITSYITLDFPNSSSHILSDINKTYLANEKVIINASFNKKIIINETFINIDSENITFENDGNNFIQFFLDTSIRNKDSKETKIITIHGKTIIGDSFKKEENYYIINSAEEFLIEKTKNAEKIAETSKNLAWWALIIAIISIIINIIQLNKKK